ncbi:hypothetical protein QN277_012950 [Acacia crassicarpa]|uniref:Uncharacterized protein n=1 Tax=Acacia crassicarpa TaxID=499986 RepID=A0AAE1N1Q5_9FABA|nr:hypothetical protein QN277_012950 [Acacia crassicarpa]
MNIKPSSKPIASPGRTDKFPPPLMRFLRTNVASRSRGRSRSSPMFVRKKNTALDSQEPSSPKVTCMGQVRVRRSSKHHHDAAAKRNRHNGDSSPTRCSRRCWWLRHGLFCCRFAAKIRPSSSCHCYYRSLWPNCGFFPIFNFRSKRTKVRQDSAASQLNLRERYNEETTTRHVGYESEEEGFQEQSNANSNTFANEYVTDMPTTPPKNALLLTRCRSAPYRSSSLASRFWGSSLNCEETEEGLKTELQNGQQAEHEKASRQVESVSDAEDREEEPEFFEEFEDSIKERIIKSENARDLKREDGGGDSARPLILTRCKSEPARTAQKLDPEFNFWKKRRMGLADSCSPHYL